MKSLAVLALAALSTAQSQRPLYTNKFVRSTAELNKVNFTNLFTPYLPLKDGVIPAKTDLKPKLQPEAVRKRIRYGPYIIPAADEDPAFSFISREKGAIDAMNKIDSICNDCLVLYGNVTLENPDGSHASLSDGLYFHHAAMVNLNRERQMYMCSGTKESKPFAAGPAQFIIGVSDDSENWFTDATSHTYKAGYYIKPQDEFILMVQVMNYNKKRRTVYMNYEVEYIPGKPAGWSDIRYPILNVAPCGMPKVDFKVPQPTYRKTSAPWKSTLNGTIVNVLGHLHDGGDAVSIRLNDKEICNSKASYGTEPEYIRQNPEAGKAWEALSHMDECSPMLPLKEGDVMTIEASYDLTKHPLRKSTDGHAEEVMGLGFVYVAVPL